MSQPTIIAVGELLVEFVSHQTGCGLRELTEYSGPYPSGAPAIFIDQAARMGASTRIYGSLGQDNFGNALVDRLNSDGVNTDCIVSHENLTTGVAFVSYFENGSRTFIFHLNNTAADAVANANFELPDGPVILHVSGSSLGNSKLRAAIQATVAKVIAAGGKISCDPNARAELMDDTQVRDALFTLMKQSSYLFPSTSDLEFLYPGKSESSSTTELCAYGADVVVLKRGAEGCIVFDKTNDAPFTGHAVSEVDPTGAGDCFCGTFLALMTQGHTVDSAARYANAAGALAVTARGPMEGNSTLEELEQFLSQQDNATNRQPHSS